MPQLLLEENGTAREVSAKLEALMNRGARHARWDQLGCVVAILGGVAAAIAGFGYERWHLTGFFGLVTVVAYWFAGRFDPGLEDDPRLLFARELLAGIAPDRHVALKLELRPHDAFAPEEKEARDDLGVRARYQQRWLELTLDQIGISIEREVTEDQHGIKVQHQEIVEWIEIQTPTKRPRVELAGYEWEDDFLVAEETVRVEDLLTLVNTLEA